MRKHFSAFIILLFATLTFANGTEWFKGSFEEAMEKAAKEGKLILVHFYSPN